MQRAKIIINIASILVTFPKLSIKFYYVINTTVLLAIPNKEKEENLSGVGAWGESQPIQNCTSHNLKIQTKNINKN